MGAAHDRFFDRAVIEASILKVFASEAYGTLLDDGLQVHGGYGFIEEYSIERAYREAFAAAAQAAQAAQPPVEAPAPAPSPAPAPPAPTPEVIESRVSVVRAPTPPDSDRRRIQSLTKAMDAEEIAAAAAPVGTVIGSVMEGTVTGGVLESSDKNGVLPVTVFSDEAPHSTADDL